MLTHIHPVPKISFHNTHCAKGSIAHSWAVGKGERKEQKKTFTQTMRWLWHPALWKRAQKYNSESDNVSNREKNNTNFRPAPYSSPASDRTGYGTSSLEGIQITYRGSCFLRNVYRWVIIYAIAFASKPSPLNEKKTSRYDWKRACTGWCLFCFVWDLLYDPNDINDIIVPPPWVGLGGLFAKQFVIH